MEQDPSGLTRLLDVCPLKHRPVFLLYLTDGCLSNEKLLTESELKKLFQLKCINHCSNYLMDGCVLLAEFSPFCPGYMYSLICTSTAFFAQLVKYTFANSQHFDFFPEPVHVIIICLYN